jgi:hypothetical protein
MDLNHGTTVHVGKLDIRSTDLIIYNYHINLTLRIRYIVEMPVKNQLQGMLAVFEPLDRAQSKKNF